MSSNVFSKADIEQLFYIDDSVSYLNKILIANKDTGKLLVVNPNKTIDKELPMASGREKGDKFKQGDLKTPEGLYRFESLLTESSLKTNYPKDFQIYGTGALISNYPNPIDIINNKTGSGIWIHGTNDESRINKTYDSRGCFVLKNKEILNLLSELNLEKTLLLSFSNFTNDKINKEEVDSIKLELSKWKDSWKLMNESYFSFYNEKFFNKDFKDKTDYVSHKKEQFKNNKILDIDIKDFFVFKKNNYYYVSFKQDYKSNKTKDIGVKELWLEKTNNKLSIVYESWVPFKI